MIFKLRRPALPTAAMAPKGRSAPILSGGEHFVSGRPLLPPYPAGIEQAVFGLGCFWGAERLFWQLGRGIWITAVGYSGGLTPNPTYDELCTGTTGHAEVVLVAYNPQEISYETLLKVFWEAHDPTQGNRQGNDVGTQYRSTIYTTSPGQHDAAMASRAMYSRAIAGAGYDAITTEIAPLETLYFAEGYHQQYLAKVPHGHCGLSGTGVACPMPGATAKAAEH